MKKIKLLFGIGLAVLAINSVWQFGASEVKNVQLQDDMRDLASQLDARIGFSVPKTDEDYRNAVIRKAEGYGIQLAPEQVTVERTGSGEKQAIYLAANYHVEVKLPGFSIPLHFTPSGGEKRV